MVAMDSPATAGLNAPPGLYRLRSRRCGTFALGQLVADMFMQVLIERGDVFITTLVTVHLYFVGGDYLEFKYPHRLMDVSYFTYEELAAL